MAQRGEAGRFSARLTEDGSLKVAADGRVVFASEQDGRNHLYSIAASGGVATLLTPGDFDVEDVTLSADKAWVIYSSNQDDVDRRHLWRVAVAGGTPQQALTRRRNHGVVSRSNRRRQKHSLPGLHGNIARHAI